MGWMGYARAALAASGAVLMIPTAAAQDTGGTAAAPGSPAAQDGEGAQLGDIIVTATKRAESLQDVPLAVTAIGGDSIREAQISDLSEIAVRVPSFTFQQQNGLEQELFIRGIGTVRLNSATADPSIGYFLDEVYVGRRGTATPPIFDVERVEVLRGPQGTLFGKNVVGGAISLVTGRPSREVSAFNSVSVGNYQAVNVQGYVTAPVADNAETRLAYFVNRHDGYARNIVTGQALEDIETYALRASLAIRPSENLRLLLIADASQDDGNGSSRHAVDDPTRATPGFITANLRSQDPRTSETPYEQYLRRTTAGFTLRGDLDIGSASLTYLGAYRYGDAGNRWSQAGAGSPPSITDSVLTQAERYKGITQELRLASSQAGSFRWLAGLYYLREDTNRSSRNTARSFLPGGAGSTRDSLDGDNIFRNRGIVQNYAVYGEVEYDLTPTITLTAGARYTIDDKDFTASGEILSLGPPGLPNTLSPAPLLSAYAIAVDQSWRRLTPRALVEWKPSNDFLVYASATRGFKGGGWQSAAANAAAARVAYNPESAWNYEVGVKSQFLDDRVRVNAAAFYTDFKDLQVEQLDDVALTLVVANAATARIKGVEAEVQVQPIRELSFFASGSLLDARYGEYIDRARNLNFSNNRLIRTPDYQFNVGGNLSVPVGDYRLGANVIYTYQDRIFWGPENSNREDGYGLLDARVSIATADNQITLTAFAKNLTNTLYRTSIIPFAGDEVSLFGAPRTYGGRVAWRF